MFSSLDFDSRNRTRCAWSGLDILSSRSLCHLIRWQSGLSASISTPDQTHWVRFPGPKSRDENISRFRQMIEWPTGQYINAGPGALGWIPAAKILRWRYLQISSRMDRGEKGWKRVKRFKRGKQRFLFTPSRSCLFHYVENLGGCWDVKSKYLWPLTAQGSQQYRDSLLGPNQQSETVSWVRSDSSI